MRDIAPHFHQHRFHTKTCFGFPMMEINVFYLGVAFKNCIFKINFIKEVGEIRRLCKNLIVEMWSKSKVKDILTVSWVVMSKRNDIQSTTCQNLVIFNEKPNIYKGHFSPWQLLSWRMQVKYIVIQSWVISQDDFKVYIYKVEGGQNCFFWNLSKAHTYYYWFQGGILCVTFWLIHFLTRL